MKSFGSRERQEAREGGRERRLEPSWREVRAEPGLQPPLGFPAAAAFPYPKNNDRKRLRKINFRWSSWNSV